MMDGDEEFCRVVACLLFSLINWGDGRGNEISVTQKNNFFYLNRSISNQQF
jgi:hypothetical protein